MNDNAKYVRSWKEYPDLEGRKKYEIFWKHLGREEYDKAQLFLLGNGEIKNFLTKEEWRSMYESVESSILNLISELLETADKSLEVTLKNLERGSRI